MICINIVICITLNILNANNSKHSIQFLKWCHSVNISVHLSVIIRNTLPEFKNNSSFLINNQEYMLKQTAVVFTMKYVSEFRQAV